MTPTEALRAAARAEDEAGVRTLLVSLSETERSELIPAARELVAAETRKGIAAAGHLGPALLIAYGVLPLTDIRKLGWRAGHLPSHLDEVLRNRSSERLVPIVEYLLDDVSQGAWPVVRTLVRDQVVPRPDRPSYTIAMLAATRWRDAADLIADDPGLLDVEIWRLFEVEGGGEDSLANHEKFFGDSWGNVLRNLASHDDLVRQRLLDASLDALARDFAPYRAGWFSRFHESLAPTDDERVARADRYLGLLRSRVGPTVSFAVAALVRIERAGGLPSEAFLERIGPVLGEGPAGTAKTGLRLVGSAGRGSADLARKAAIVAADALTNAAPDVQKSAIALIGELITEADEAVARAVAHRLPEVAASQRTAATGLIARLGEEGVTSLPVVPAPALAARKANPAGRVPSALPRPSPVDPDRAIEPLATIEALVDVAVSVLETGEPADDVERVLDAVGRLSTDPSDDRARLTRAIAKRARVILARRESRPFTGHDPRADIAGVLLAWAGGELVDPSTDRGSIDLGPGAFLSARAYEVACAVAAGRSFSSVASPTHTGGWIEPAELVRRLGTRQPASKLDLVAAILRLAPDGWDEARISAADLDGEVGAVVRYALGGDERIGSTAAWWVAAARVRAPGHDDVAVEKRHSGLGPDAGRAARIRMKLVQRVGASPVAPAGLGLEIEPPLTGNSRGGPTHRADAPRSVGVLLDGELRAGHVPLDRDDPARVSGGPVGNRRADAGTQRRLVVGRVGQPGLPRAIHRSGDGRGVACQGAHRHCARSQGSRRAGPGGRRRECCPGRWPHGRVEPRGRIDVGGRRRVRPTESVGRLAGGRSRGFGGACRRRRRGHRRIAECPGRPPGGEAGPVAPASR